MDIHTLIDGLPVTPEASQTPPHPGVPPAMPIDGITDDSRLVQPRWLFIARAGHATDGRRFIDDAIQRGAAAVLANVPMLVPPPPGVAMLVAEDLPAVTVALLNRFHGNPAGRLKLIGITGTNGKTTTTFLIRHLLAAAGRRCGLIGTVEIDDGRDRRPSNLTTPGMVELFGMLAAMANNGCDTCVMEVSSHALDQGRVRGLKFAVGIFTNLTGDHLDYHRTMEAYGDAKAKLFDSLAPPPEGAAVVNRDDPAHERMLRDSPARRLTFSPAGNVEADCYAKIIEATARYTECMLHGPWGELRVRLPLIGLHNVANILGAVAAVHALGVDVMKLREALESCPQVPGRLERVTVTPGADPGAPFDVLVDYAHTDDALENVLRALRPVTAGRLRVLFGCGGDRDRTKRPRMAATACRWADDVVITSDNPRTEDPQTIIADILAGIPETDRARTTVEADREAAIRRIIADAEAGDVVLLAGKGHEDYQIIGAQKRPFDDRLVAKAALGEASRRAGFILPKRTGENARRGGDRAIQAG